MHLDLLNYMTLKSEKEVEIHCLIKHHVSVYNGSLQFRGFGEFNPPPRNSEVLTKLSRIPSSVENSSITT
jgi:hypothetical protein